MQTTKWYHELGLLDHGLTMKRGSMTSMDPNGMHNRAPVFDEVNYDYWKKKMHERAHSISGHGSLKFYSHRPISISFHVISYFKVSFQFLYSKVLDFCIFHYYIRD